MADEFEEEEVLSLFVSKEIFSDELNPIKPYRVIEEIGEWVPSVIGPVPTSWEPDIFDIHDTLLHDNVITLKAIQIRNDKDITDIVVIHHKHNIPSSEALLTEPDGILVHVINGKLEFQRIGNLRNKLMTNRKWWASSEKND